MRAPEEIIGAVEEIGAERVLVQDGQVVKVEIAVIGGFPVWPRYGPLIKQVPTVETEVLKQAVIAAEIGFDIERAVGIKRRPDQARALQRREFLQAESRLVDRPEIFWGCNGEQVAVILEGPAMIAAGEARRLAAASAMLASGSTANDIRRSLKLFGNSGDRVIAVAKRRSPSILANVFTDAVAMDAKMRSGKLDSRRGIEILALRVCKAIA